MTAVSTVWFLCLMSTKQCAADVLQTVALTDQRLVCCWKGLAGTFSSRYASRIDRPKSLGVITARRGYRFRPVSHDQERMLTS